MYKSTKLQMEMERRRVADQKVEHMQEKMDLMMEQMSEMRQMIVSSQRQQEETNSAPRHASSNSPHTPGYTSIPPQQNTRIPEVVIEEANNNGRVLLEDVAESNVGTRVLNTHDDPPLRRQIVNVEKHNRQQGGGKDVILYSVTRPLNVPVAKGTIQTTNPKALVGGVSLGPQYVEIVIHTVFKRDIVLPRPYGDVLTMGDAKGKSIAWPSAMIKDEKKSTNVPGGAGT